MEKTEQKELTAQLRGVISDYSGPDEDGVVKGLLYAVYLIEHGKDYADRKIKLPRKGDGSWSCGCE